MVKRKILVLIGLATVLLAAEVPAQPTNLGELCFRKASSAAADMDYRLQLTHMGYNHFALTGSATHVGGLPHASGSPVPVHGNAELHGSFVYMTLQESGLITAAFGDGETFWVGTLHVVFPVPGTAGTFRNIWHTHATPGETLQPHYATGTFSLQACP